MSGTCPTGGRRDVAAGGGLSSLLYLVLTLAGVGDAILHLAPFRWIGVVATILFLVLEIRNLPRFQAAVGVVLVTAGLGVGSLNGSVAQVLIDGLAKAQLFLVLFFAIAWLQEPAAASPALRAVRRTVVSQPPGRRFLALAGGGHLLGAVLNVAGLALLSTMVERQTDPTLQRRMASALMQGYVAASMWSPFFVSVVVVLVALPELGWAEVISGGLPLAAIVMAWAWLFDRLRYTRRRAAQPPPPGHPLSMRHRLHLAATLGSLVVIVIAIVEFSGLPLPVILAFVGPPFGAMWMALVAGPATPASRSAGRLARAVFGRLPGLRNEALAFVASSIFGVGVAAGFPAELLAGVPGGGWAITGLVFGVVALGFLGLHPVVPVIFIGEALGPDVLGLPAKIIAMALLGAWGLSTLVSPVSGTTLVLSRFVAASSHVMAWRWNPPYVMGAAAIVSLSVYMAWRMHLY